MQINTDDLSEKSPYIIGGAAAGVVLSLMFSPLMVITAGALAAGGVAAYREIQKRNGSANTCGAPVQKEQE